MEERQQQGQEQTQTIEQQQSVKIGISQKGKWSAEVKSYAATVDEAMVLALKKANELDILISEKNQK